jgi:hypothetical protein
MSSSPIGLSPKGSPALAPSIARSLAAVIGLSVCAATSAYPQGRTDGVVGRRLIDVLRTLQAEGVRLVFSSELVTPDQRVTVEPQAAATAQRLAELLAPHGLEARVGPAGIIEIVRRRRPKPAHPDRRPPPSPNASVRLDGGDAEPTYRERVTVTADAWRGGHAPGATGRHVTSELLDLLGSRIADDPLRSLQALPGVATGDDFRSALSVRGSAFRHSSVIVDGVEAPWLQHAAPGHPGAGTMTMMPGEVVHEATMRVGAYARRDSSQLGPQLNLTLRDGSRAGHRLQAAVSGVSTSVIAEGPLRAGEGSWIVAARHGNAEWPLGRSDHQGPVFAFGDAQAKLVYELGPRQHVSASVIAGLSRLDRDAEDPAAPAAGFNRAVLASLAWRSVAGAHTVIHQQGSVMDHAYGDSDGERRTVGGGSNAAGAYRLDVTQGTRQGLIQTGLQVRSVRQSGMVGPGELATPGGFPLEWIERSAYAAVRWTPAPALTLIPAARALNATLTAGVALDRTVEAEWRPAQDWLLHGSAGVVHQAPDFAAMRHSPAPPRPERAAQLDVGVAHHLTPAFRWDVTAYARRERDVQAERGGLRAPPESAPDDYREDPISHTLEGAAQGIELTIERRGAGGPSGSISYAYGVARQTNRARGERFRADHDQRHTLNIAAFAPMPHRIRVSGVFRAGSNFPLPGYFVERSGSLFQGTQRNAVPLRAYARLDLRAERSIERGARRLTIFAEALNVLNRRNAGPAQGTVVAGTGQAIGFTERRFPRLVTAGVRLGF